MRRKLIAANWKMHKTPQEAREFFKSFFSEINSVDQKTKLSDREIYFFVPAFCAEAAAQSLSANASQPGSSMKVKWGAQNLFFEAKGAFTGENSPAVLKELGGEIALVGHSERRALFSENDQLLAKKVRALQDMNIEPMLCVGETLAQRQAGETEAVLTAQLEKGLELARTTHALVIAYEPVWAIGTGQVATVEQVRETHAFVRSKLDSMGFENASLLYGGSVKADNAKELFSVANVDGFLVGGASLEISTWMPITTAGL